MMTLMFIPIIFTLIISNFSSNTTNDWVEVVNPTESEINFSEYFLTDVAGNKIEKDILIPAKGNCVFDWSNKLNNGGDTIFLQKKDTTQVDCVKYKDGAKGECANTRDPTETKPNTNCFEKPKATEQPNTPAPASPSGGPTVVLTQKPQPASPTVAPTPMPTPDDDEPLVKNVLSAETQAPEPSDSTLSFQAAQPDSEPVQTEETTDKNKNIAIFSLATGSVLIATSAVLIYKKEYNKI